MKVKRFTLLDRFLNPVIDKCFEFNTLRLIGIFWKERVEYFIDRETQDIVVRYK